MPQRIQRMRSKGWLMPQGAVYVGRPTKWGNPFTHGPESKAYLGSNVRFLSSCMWSAAQVVEMYEQWILGLHVNELLAGGRLPVSHLLADPPKSLTELCGHDLACWCRLDQPCHADVLLRLANS